MRRRWRALRSNDPAELNITAFMNLMVVLVPFLLITAVFSRMAVLELELPAQGDGSGEPPAFALEVLLRDGRLDVNDRQSGPLASFAHVEGQPDLKALSGYLQQLKAKFPDESSATLLLEADIQYERLVDVMDTVRAVAVPTDDGVGLAELFPEISLGDAPEDVPAVAAAGN